MSREEHSARRCCQRPVFLYSHQIVVDYGECGWQGSLRFVTGTEVWFLKDERGLEHLWLVMRVVCVCFLMR